MNPKHNHLDLVTLLGLYTKAVDDLKQKLLEGHDWEDLYGQRRPVTELAAAIYQKEPHLDLLQLGDVERGAKRTETPAH
jgi:hypothetical protein